MGGVPSEVTGEEREVEIAQSALQMGTVNLLAINAFGPINFHFGRSYHKPACVTRW